MLSLIVPSLSLMSRNKALLISSSIPLSPLLRFYVFRLCLCQLLQLRVKRLFGFVPAERASSFLEFFILGVRLLLHFHLSSEFLCPISTFSPTKPGVLLSRKNLM